MNRAITAQRFHTTGLLSLALLISLTSDGGHLPEHPDGTSPEALIRALPNCAQTLEPQDLVVDETVVRCDSSELEATLPRPIRLARPLSGSPYPRPGDSTRYSF